MSVDFYKGDIHNPGDAKPVKQLSISPSLLHKHFPGPPFPTDNRYVSRTETDEDEPFDFPETLTFRAADLGPAKLFINWANTGRLQRPDDDGSLLVNAEWGITDGQEYRRSEVSTWPAIVFARLELWSRRVDLKPDFGNAIIDAFLVSLYSKGVAVDGHSLGIVSHPDIPNPTTKKGAGAAAATKARAAVPFHASPVFLAAAHHFAYAANPPETEAASVAYPMRFLIYMMLQHSFLLARTKGEQCANCIASTNDAAKGPSAGLALGTHPFREPISAPLPDECYLCDRYHLHGLTEDQDAGNNPDPRNWCRAYRMYTFGTLYPPPLAPPNDSFAADPRPITFVWNVASHPIRRYEVDTAPALRAAGVYISRFSSTDDTGHPAALDGAAGGTRSRSKRTLQPARREVAFSSESDRDALAILVCYIRTGHLKYRPDFLTGGYHTPWAEVMGEDYPQPDITAFESSAKAASIGKAADQTITHSDDDAFRTAWNTARVKANKERLALEEALGTDLAIPSIDDCSTWPFRFYVELYVWAYGYKMGGFCNAIVDSLCSTIKDRPRFLSALELDYVYGYRIALDGVENPLYRVIVDWFFLYVYPDIAGYPEPEDLLESYYAFPKPFVLAVLRLQRMAIQAPQNCKKCCNRSWHAATLAYAKYFSLGANGRSTLMPIHSGICKAYHKHANGQVCDSRIIPAAD